MPTGDLPDRIGVLVVDDQRQFRRAAVALVRSVSRFELLGEAESGEQAVALATELRPDFVVMDVRLPGIGGHTAASQILAEQPGIRVLLVSTYELADLPPSWPGAVRPASSASRISTPSACCTGPSRVDGVMGSSRRAGRLGR